MGAMKGRGGKASETSGAQTLLRGLWLLERVADGVHDLPGLAQALGLSRSTAHRILSALVREGYLRHEPRKGYFLGPKLIRLGFKAYGSLHLPSLARPHLGALRDATLETVHLAVLDGKEVVYIDKVPGKRELLLASQIGSRFPAQSTALGKALLAFLPEERWPMAFTPGLKRTPNTLSDFARFREELLATRARGYALDLGERARRAVRGRPHPQRPGRARGRRERLHRRHLPGRGEASRGGGRGGQDRPEDQPGAWGLRRALAARTLARTASRFPCKSQLPPTAKRLGKAA